MKSLGFCGAQLYSTLHSLSRPGPGKKKFERLIFPTKYVIPKSLKFSHWPSKSNRSIVTGVFQPYFGVWINEKPRYLSI